MILVVSPLSPWSYLEPDSPAASHQFPYMYNWKIARASPESLGNHMTPTVFILRVFPMEGILTTPPMCDLDLLWIPGTKADCR